MSRISKLLLILLISFCGGSEVSNNETLISSTTTTTTVADSTTTSTTTTTVVSADYPQLTISEISSSIPEYNRDDWNHWIDENGDCQNTRHEVLIEESFETVTYTNDTYCLVSTGKWFGSYTGQYYYNASELDIDHFIPLKNAHQSGGYNWSSAKKEEFANYRLDPDNLIAVSLSANSSKGAKGPDEWKPTNTEYWCEYAYDWIRIKDYWNLTATQAEWDALVSMIETCPPGFAYADAEEEPVLELPTPTTTTTTTTTTIPESINVSSISQSFGLCYDADSKRNSTLSVTNNGSEQIDYIAEMKIDGGIWEYRGNHYLGIGQTNPTATDAAVPVGSSITWRIQLYKNPSEYYEINILGPVGPVSCP